MKFITFLSPLHPFITLILVGFFWGCLFCFFLFPVKEDSSSSFLPADCSAVNSCCL